MNRFAPLIAIAALLPLACEDADRPSPQQPGGGGGQGGAEAPGDDPGPGEGDGEGEGEPRARSDGEGEGEGQAGGPGADGGETADGGDAGDGEGEADPADGGEDEGGEGEGGEGEAGGEPDPACREFRRLLKPHPPTIARVMIVVDRSYSMIEDDDRWTPVTEALGQVTAALEGVARFGLLMFPHPDRRVPPEGVPAACIPGEINVEPGPESADEILRRLQEARPRPDTGTPTAAALRTAGDWLRQARTDNDYILLATDGGPGCNTELDPLECVCNVGSGCCLFEAAHNCLDDAGATGVVRELAQDGIRTLVLGITEGQDDDGGQCGPAGQCGPNARCVGGSQMCVQGRCTNQLGRVLDDLAVAGGTAVDGRHFEVADLQALDRQIAAAAGSVVPCAYTLDALAEHADRLVVEVDGVEVARDPGQVDGWDVREDALEFFGRACQALRDGRPHEITATCR